MTPLTVKQKLVFEFLKSEIREKGYPPTVREICDAVGLRSTSTVHAHLATLERKGYIRRAAGKNRSTEILEDNFYSKTAGYVEVPILSKVVKDNLFAEENIEGSFPMPAEYVKDGKYFMLTVKSDLYEGYMFRGDLLLVRQQEGAEDGDMVVVFYEDYALPASVRFVGTIIVSPLDDVVGEFFGVFGLDDCIGKIVGLYRSY